MSDPIPTRIWRWSEVPFPLSNGLNIYVRYPIGEVSAADAERFADFMRALLVQLDEEAS